MSLMELLAGGNTKMTEDQFHLVKENTMKIHKTMDECNLTMI